jgi:ribosomal-protein-alanine N-acetyltransferase
MSQVIVHTGDIRTVEAIMPVMQAAFDPMFGEAWNSAQCAGILTLPDTILLYATLGGEVVGFALARAVFEEAELLLIATHPDFRRRGVGRKLLDSVIAWAKSKSSKLVFLEVREDNKALELYFSVGFIQVGRREAYYRGLEDACFAALTLRHEIAS